MSEFELLLEIADKEFNERTRNGQDLWPSQREAFKSGYTVHARKTANLKTETRIRLEEPALRGLLRGGEVTIEVAGGSVVKMILADIGFDQCRAALADAEFGIDHYKPVTVDCDGKEKA